MKYYITTFSLTSDGAQEMVSAAADVLKALLCEAGYEAFEDIDDLKMLNDTDIMSDLEKLDVIKVVENSKALENLKITHDVCFQAYIQQNIFDENSVKEAIAQMPFEDLHINYIIREAEDKNWNEAWEREQEPTEICKQLGITIDVKQAFGTGGHNTTHMILTRLTESNLEGKSVLDCGCGSGILSIAAIKMGASHATAYDIDEWSVENTKHNAQLNGVQSAECRVQSAECRVQSAECRVQSAGCRAQSKGCRVLHGDSSCLNTIEEKFDYVLANINRNILLHDMPIFVQHMKEGGHLLLSGFYEEDADMLIDKATTLGLELIHEKTSSNWKLLELVLKR